MTNWYEIDFNRFRAPMFNCKMDLLCEFVLYRAMRAIPFMCAMIKSFYHCRPMKIRSRNFLTFSSIFWSIITIYVIPCLMCHKIEEIGKCNEQRIQFLKEWRWKIATKMSSFVYRRFFFWFTYKCSTVETPKLFCLL